jgi:hypothetical protein
VKSRQHFLLPETDQKFGIIRFIDQRCSAVQKFQEGGKIEGSRAILQNWALNLFVQELRVNITRLHLLPEGNLRVAIHKVCIVLNSIGT